MKRGFTLAELLIVSLILMIIVGIVALTNFGGQMYRAKDATRKSDLNNVRGMLESYYKDHNQYPPVELMGTVIPGKPASYMCGFEVVSEEIKNYISRLPCDPDHDKGRKYVYSTHNDGQDYVLLANLQNETDIGIDESGCRKGCSFVASLSITFLDKPYVFNYAVSSDATYPITQRSRCNIHEAYICENSTCTSCSDGRCNPMSLEERGEQLYCFDTWCKSTSSGDSLKNCP